jgi:propanediol dehydratase small subunit
MTKHPKYVKGFNGSLDDLAKAVGNMTYDQTASFLEKLADDLKKQADGDYAKGRTKLSSELYKTAEQIYIAKDKMYEAWKTCEPYMKD